MRNKMYAGAALERLVYEVNINKQSKKPKSVYSIGNTSMARRAQKSPRGERQRQQTNERKKGNPKAINEFPQTFVRSFLFP